MNDILYLNHRLALGMMGKNAEGHEWDSLTSCLVDYRLDVAKCRRVSYTTVLLSHATEQEGKIYLSLMKTHFPFCKSWKLRKCDCELLVKWFQLLHLDLNVHLTLHLYHFGVFWSFSVPCQLLFSVLFNGEGIVVMSLLLWCQLLLPLHSLLIGVW
jgi:hypothetical protein